VDTQTSSWLAADDARLSAQGCEDCRAKASLVSLGALSALRIEIKHRLGRLPMPLTPSASVATRRNWLALETFHSRKRSAVCDADLPPLHRGPFDRGLVSQATVFGLTIVTPDPDIRACPVPTIWQGTPQRSGPNPPCGSMLRRWASSHHFRGGPRLGPKFLRPRGTDSPQQVGGREPSATAHGPRQSDLAAKTFRLS